MPLSPQDREEAAKRAAIMNSPEYHKWWENRREMQPTPSDPYRAYMIDRGLRAKPYDEFSWVDYVNRSDLEPIDNYQNGEPDTRPPRHINHKHIDFKPASKIRPSHDKEKLYKQLYGYTEDLRTHYGAPEVDLIIEKRTAGAFYAPSGYTGGKPAIYIPESYYNAVKSSGKKAHVNQLFASVGHEGGHHISRSGIIGATMPKIIQIREKSKQDTERKTEEVTAWNLSEDFIEEKKPKHATTKGMGKLRKRFALSTYGVNPEPPAFKSKVVLDLGTNLILRPHESNSSIMRSSKIRISNLSELNKLTRSATKSVKRTKRRK